MAKKYTIERTDPSGKRLGFESESFFRFVRTIVPSAIPIFSRTGILGGRFFPLTFCWVYVYPVTPGTITARIMIDRIIQNETTDALFCRRRRSASR